MKIRFGFVSNSSSSSFCIFGTSMSKNEFLKIISENKEIMSKFMEDQKEYFNSEWLTDHDNNMMEALSDYDDIFEYLGKYMNNLEIHAPYDFDYVYIGRSFTSIGDDETGASFKKNVKENIDKYFDNEQCKTISKSWYNG